MSTDTIVKFTTDGSVHHAPIRSVAQGGPPRPLWSVMIPTFNCARFLRQTLQSVLCQDPGPEVMQIEVVDDCSTQDDPQQVVWEVGRGRVRFHRQPQNVGHIRNFETCLQRSTGQLIHLLHGDDAVLFGFYRKMERVFAAKPGVGAAFCRFAIVDESGHWTKLAPPTLEDSDIVPNMLERLAIQQIIQTPSVVVRRAVYEALGSFDRRLSWTEDWEMWARIAANFPWWYENEPLALYRQHSTSSTSRHIRDASNIRDACRALDMIVSYLPEKDRTRSRLRARDLWAMAALKQSSKFIHDKDWDAAKAQFVAALECSKSGRVLTECARTMCAWIIHWIRD